MLVFILTLIGDSKGDSKMITTVTTISSITTVAGMGLATALSAVATISLIAFLTTRELLSAGATHSSQRAGRFMSVGIIPLLLVFAAVVAAAIAEVL